MRTLPLTMRNPERDCGWFLTATAPFGSSRQISMQPSLRSTTITIVRPYRKGLQRRYIRSVCQRDLEPFPRGQGLRQLALLRS